MPPYGQRWFREQRWCAGLLAVLALLPSRPPSSETQREATRAANHTQKPFAIHQGRVQNEVICLQRGRRDEGGQLDAGVSDAAQLACALSGCLSLFCLQVLLLALGSRAGLGRGRGKRSSWVIQ